MRLCTFITFFSYQNIRSLPPYLSIPLFDLALTVTPLKQFTLLHAIWDIEHRCAGLSPARPIPFLPSFFLVFYSLVSSILVPNDISPYINIRAPALPKSRQLWPKIPPLSCVCAGQPKPIPSFPSRLNMTASRRVIATRCLTFDLPH